MQNFSRPLDQQTRQVNARRLIIKNELAEIVKLAKSHHAAPADVIEEWEREWHNTFFSKDVVSKYCGNLEALDKLEATLHRMRGLIQLSETIGSARRIDKEFTAEYIKERIDSSTQHSFSKHARVSGRYAATTGVETGRRSNEGGYYLARY